jgi:hypothetical protein
MEYFFPEKKEGASHNGDPAIRGKGGDEVVKLPLLKRITRNKSLKVGMVVIFIASMVGTYNKELVKVLSESDVIELAKSGNGRCARVISKFIEENKISQTPESIRNLAVADRLGFDEKAELLKIKIEYILKNNFPGKRKYIILLLFGVVITCAVTSAGGLALILDALRKLFEKGKISEALYEELKMSAIAQAQS